MKYSGIAVWLILALAWISPPAVPAQPAPPRRGNPARWRAETPPPRDPVLYRLFFRHQRTLSREIARTTPGNPAKSAALSNAAARRLGITPEQFARLTPVSDALSAELKQIDREAIAYGFTRGRKAELAVLQGFEQRRLQAAERARTRAAEALPASAWSSVEQYINGRFRMFRMNTTRRVFTGVQ